MGKLVDVTKVYKALDALENSSVVSMPIMTEPKGISGAQLIKENIKFVRMILETAPDERKYEV